MKNKLIRIALIVAFVLPLLAVQAAPTQAQSYNDPPCHFIVLTTDSHIAESRSGKALQAGLRIFSCGGLRVLIEGGASGTARVMPGTQAFNSAGYVENVYDVTFNTNSQLYSRVFVLTAVATYTLYYDWEYGWEIDSVYYDGQMVSYPRHAHTYGGN